MVYRAMLKELRRLFFASILLFFVAYVQADTPPDQAQKSSSASKSDSRTSCLNKIPTPISIPVRNVTLDDGTLRRGAALSVGTPSQALAFAVNPYVASSSAPILPMVSRFLGSQTIPTSTIQLLRAMTKTRVPNARRALAVFLTKENRRHLHHTTTTLRLALSDLFQIGSYRERTPSK